MLSSQQRAALAFAETRLDSTTRAYLKAVRRSAETPDFLYLLMPVRVS